MAELSKEIQTFIVQQFAMFGTPQEIVDLVKENYGVETSRPQVFFYNADMNPKFPKKWREIFAATRKRFLEDVSLIPIASRNYRLRELDTMYHDEKRKTEAVRNKVGMRDTLEQAAKEVGDAYTNKREISGARGESLTQPIADAMNQFNTMLHKVYAVPDGAGESETKTGI